MQKQIAIYEGDAAQSAPRESWLDRPLLASVTWEHVLYIAFILIAIVSRLYDLGLRVMSHDESLHTYYSFNLAMGRGFQHTPLMHGPFLFHITALSYFLFGDSDFTARLPMALLGIVMVALPWFFRRWLGRTGALVASFAFLISPSILYHSRYIRQEQSILIWSLLTALCVWRYIEGRNWRWLIGLSIVLAFHATDKSTSFLTVAMYVIFLAPLALWELYRWRKNRRDWLNLIFFGAVLAALLVLISALYAALGNWLAGVLGLKDIAVGVNNIVLSLDRQELVFIGILIAISAPLVIAMALLLRSTFGKWLAAATEAAPSLNVLLVMVTTTLFMGSAALLLVLNRFWHRISGADLVEISLLGTMSNLANNAQVVTTMFAISFALIAISVAIGIVWNIRRWLVITAVFIGVTLPLFTTLFTNGAGVGSGYVGMLGYWMAQQDVERGSQPIYYYFLIVPLYEYLVLFGAICAVIYMAYRAVSLLRAPKPMPIEMTESAAEPIDDSSTSTSTTTLTSTSPIGTTLASVSTLFPIFLVWWTAATWIIYTVAGEKMPWLTVHFALPMALLTGWFLQRVINGDVFAQFRQRKGWAAFGLAALAVVLMGRALSILGGLDLSSGNPSQTFAFIGNVLVVVVGLALVFYALGKLVTPGVIGRLLMVAIFAFLSVLTVRTAIMASYINYDYAREFLFYAHGAPGVKIALNQMEDLSKRLGGKEPLSIGYDSDTSWPMSWYMREFPGQRFYGEALPDDFSNMQVILLGDGNPRRSDNEQKLAGQYVKFDYMLVWWPMQDYYDLNKGAQESQFGADGFTRIRYMLSTPRAREALWQIIFNRNFQPYAELFNRRDLTPDNWSPGHRFFMYVRNDVATQVWDYRVGQVAGAPAPAASSPNVTTVESPSMIAFAPDGSRYVIDHKGNRVFKLNNDNSVVSSFGGFGGGAGKFNDPWGLAIAADGSIYVADTFNHRIQKFDKDGNFVTTWGKPGMSDAAGIGQDTVFFGPRDIKIDSAGNFLVSDTGNKRIQVFDPEGNFIAQIGKAGAGDGEFNEPVGIAIDATGNIYVADTWNKRIQVFDPSYKFLRKFDVAAWQSMDPNVLQSVENKPYLAINGDTIYISSPRSGQVVAYSLAGQLQPLADVTFNPNDWPTGLAVHDNMLFVTNAANGQVSSFALAGAVPQ